MRRGGRSPSSLSSAAPPGGRVLLLFSSFQPSPKSLCGPGAWDSQRAAGAQPITSHHSLKALAPHSSPAVGCSQTGFYFSKIAAFPCNSLQVRRLPGTRGFPARWSAGENRNLSSVARGKGEKLRSPGTGCGAASGELHAGHSLS